MEKGKWDANVKKKRCWFLRLGELVEKKNINSPQADPSKQLAQEQMLKTSLTKLMMVTWLYYYLMLYLTLAYSLSPSLSRIRTALTVYKDGPC